MYLINENGRHLFFHEDPKADGYDGKVIEVDLEYDIDKLSLWPEGTPRPVQWLGKSNENNFKVFASAEKCAMERYTLIGPQVNVLRSWNPEFANAR